MNDELYARLSTRSRRSLIKRHYQVGRRAYRNYYYRPRRRLLARLCEELNQSVEAVIEQLYEERYERLSQLYGSEVSREQIHHERDLALQIYV
ncbi:hypothetical protein [Leptolyngbya sp. FACHB-261]|uniref:hypothetical protein n=1 Tax=Leptolyngbya sp. FACHB-261 TaxID=2692806 RepID=UPI00168688DA|nr:hypothetical protein [Leptolyngbya sp. FACHB-261]MBD2100267.1 hypothetical protein [Leptolyngbya sp. FACHB-261]